ncbi:MAG: tripartite tricarboxylate transporter TctB family protein [Natronomonas sp.]
MAQTDADRSTGVGRSALAGFYILVAAYVATILWFAGSYRPDTALFPTVVGGAVALGICARVGTRIVGVDSGITDDFRPDVTDEPRPRMAAVVLAWATALVGAIAVVGLLPATTFVVSTFIIVHTRDLRLAFVGAVVVFAVGYLLFQLVLEASSYGGLLWDWIGVRPLV